MGQGRALRRARRAGGVDDHRGVFVGAVGGVLDGLRLAQRPLELAGADHDAVGAGVPGPAGRLIFEVRPGHEHPRARVLQEVGHLARFVQRVHRDHDRTGSQGPEVHDREVRDVRELHPDAIALADTLSSQDSRRAGHRCVERRVCEGEVVQLDRLAVRVLASGL